MNTPAHVAASLLVWRKEPGRKSAAALAFGAVLPDLPMFIFYGHYKLVEQASEKELWSTLFFQEQWQLFFDVFNSIPLFLLVVGLGVLLKRRWLMLLGASAILHCCCDLPLHHEDAHRHFLPLTHWRFISPVSYWDPKHFGIPVMIVELLFGLGASVYVARKGEHSPIRKTAWGTLAFYLATIAFVLILWVPTLGA